MNALSRITEIMVTVVLLFLIPLFYMVCQQDYMMQLYIQEQVIYFVDSVRNVGYLNVGMYEGFEKKLAMSGHTFEIEMSYYEKKYEMETENLYYTGYYTDDLKEAIYERDTKTFVMHQGDSFMVKVENKDATLAARLFHVVTCRKLPFQTLCARYGGMIRSECI